MQEAWKVVRWTYPEDLPGSCERDESWAARDGGLVEGGVEGRLATVAAKLKAFCR